MFWHDKLLKLFAKLKQLKILQPLQQECGAILVFTAVAIPIFLAFVGFGFDVGNLYMHKARLQNVADAAALAGAKEYLDKLDISEDGGTINGGDTPDNHPNADRVANEYITKNRINLPNSTLSNDYNSLKIRKSTTDSKTPFYRVGLKETVDLHFLPIISGIPKNQIVRAEAIAIAVKGKTTEEQSQEPQESPPLNTSGYSIFQNLFTYSNSLDIGKASYIEYQSGTLTGSSEVKAGFDGNIVYTYQNGNDDKVDKNQKAFFNDERLGIEAGNPDYNNLQHYYEEICKFTGEKNDPTINMRNGTEDYYNAFIKKLLTHPYVEVNNQNFNVVVPAVSQVQNLFKVSNSSASYKLLGNDYYEAGPVYAKNGNNTTSDIVLYHKFPDQNEYVRCIKRITDDTEYYYLVNNQDQIVMNSYITARPNPNWWPPTIEETHGITSLSDYKNNTSFPTTLSNFQQTTTTSQLNEDIFFVTRDKIGTSSLTIYINDKLSASSDQKKGEPVYIIVDSTVTSVKFQNFQPASTNGNDRPIVLAYLGTGEVDIENSGSGTMFNAVIYAPLATFKAGYQGTFNGSVVAKNIQMPYGNGGGDTRGQWNYKKYTKVTENSDIKSVTDNIIQPVMNDTIRNNIKTLWVNKHLVLNGQELTADNIGDKTWYNNLPFSEKRKLYQAFMQLCEENPGLMKVLWSWDGAFNQDVPPPPDPSDPSLIQTTTPDNVRLINPRLEANPFNLGFSVEEGS